MTMAREKQLNFAFLSQFEFSFIDFSFKESAKGQLWLN